MAEKMTANGNADAKSSEGANKDHNVADLKKLIRECAASAIEIKEERAELNARMADIRKRLKDSGVEVKSFEFAVRVQEMEREARDNYLDWLRVSFEALSIGAQGDMFPASKAEQAGEGQAGEAAGATA